MHGLHLFESPQIIPHLQLILFCIPLFFLILAETAMSYLFPVLVIGTGVSNVTLGLILSLSALVGLCCDFLLPLILKNSSWKWQFVLAILFAFIFPFTTVGGVIWKLPVLFLLASFCWYIYYELVLFAQQSFVVSEEKKENYSQDWGAIYLTVQLAALVGPALASSFLNINSLLALYVVTFIIGIGLLFALLAFTQTPGTKKTMPSPTQRSLELFKELRYYRVFIQRLFLVLILTMNIIFVQEIFWNFGGVFGEAYQARPGTGWMLMTAFSLPMIIGPILLTKFKIHTGKKKIVLLCTILSGLILSTVAFTNNFYVLMIIIALSGIFGSFVAPLNESIFSDLMSRLGKNRLYLLSFIRFSSSISYILSPVITGYVADQIGYKMMFSGVGVASAAVAFVIFFVLPKKMKLPQAELAQIQ